VHEFIGSALAALGALVGLGAAWANLDDSFRCPRNKRPLRWLTAALCAYSGAIYLLLFANIIPLEMSPIFLRPAHITALALLLALVIVER